MIQPAKESSIKYVTIEMIKNNEKNLVAKSIQAGLFKGIRLEQIDQTEGATPDVFILIQIEEKTLLTLCLKYYNVLSLERFDGATKTVTYFRASEEEQEKAFDKAAEIVNELHEAGRTVSDDAKIIDVGTYIQVPDAIKVSESSSKLSTVSKHSTISRSKSSYNVHKPKEKEPSVIKRTTKKPTKAMLTAMSKRIKDIADGTLTLELPEVEGDTEEEITEATSTTAAGTDDEYNPDYFMCG